MITQEFLRTPSQSHNSLPPIFIKTSHSRWISPSTSSDGSRNLQQGHVFLFFSHGNIHIQWNKCWHGNSQTSLPTRISSLHITHSPPPTLTSTDGSATTAAADAATSPTSFPPPQTIAPTSLRHRIIVSMKGIRVVPLHPPLMVE